MSLVTNRELSAMYRALTILGNRRMATVAADLKVGRMIRALTPLAEPMIPARLRIVSDAIDGREPAKLSQLETMHLTALIGAQQTEFDNQPVEVPLDGVITQADLPKEMPGESGWQNATQLGALTADLGALFQDG